MRLNKYLAACGECSRRAADNIIAAGRVSVNGEAAGVNTAVEPQRDVVCVDGRVITPVTQKLYIILNKPAGCVTTANDQFGRRTVMDYLKDIEQRVYPVGRLDYGTTGLLLLTNDGDFARRAAHPGSQIAKTYAAKIKNAPSEAAVARLARGVIIKENGGVTYKTKPAVVRASRLAAPADGKSGGKNSGGGYRLIITIREGRNRQIRKMCEAVGLTLCSLERIQIGALALGELKPGKYRILSEKEAARVFEGVEC